jgi:NAD(P)-dependent dehydrogenase (short-subunit alcohol dehydrogenase family)
MAAKSPVALIIGAGPNIGQAVFRKFASKGFKVGVAACSVKEADSTDNQLNIPSDFTKTDDVINAFDKVKKAFGIPSVIVYNGNNPHSKATESIVLTFDSQPGHFLTTR